MNQHDFNTRWSVALLMLIAAAIVVYRHSHVEVIPTSVSLQGFPISIENWSVSTDEPIDADVRRELGSGDFLSRLYMAPNEPAVDLFIAYLPSQRTGSSLHSPKNCLPGSGWTPIESGAVVLQVPGAVIHTNRYVIGRGSDRLFVLYWYQAHGRTVASEYYAKYFLMRDSIRMNRTDGALVRVITPINAEEPATSAERRAVRFATAIAPLLRDHIPQ